MVILAERPKSPLGDFGHSAKITMAGAENDQATSGHFWGQCDSFETPGDALIAWGNLPKLSLYYVSKFSPPAACQPGEAAVLSHNSRSSRLFNAPRPALVEVVSALSATRSASGLKVAKSEKFLHGPFKYTRG